MSDDRYYNPTIAYWMYRYKDGYIDENRQFIEGKGFTFELYKSEVDKLDLTIGKVEAEMRQLGGYLTAIMLANRPDKSKWSEQDLQDEKELKKCLNYMHAKRDEIEANELVQRLKTIGINLPQRPASSVQETAPQIYQTNLKEPQLTIIFNALVDGGYLAQDTDLQSWLYCFGQGSKKSLEQPLKWLKTTSALGWLVKWLTKKADKQKIWEITQRSFILKDGQHPKITTLVSKVSEVEQPYLPKAIDQIDKLLKKIGPDVWPELYKK